MESFSYRDATGSLDTVRSPVYRECGIEQCHGLDITCGPNVPKMCTMEMRIDDFCRDYVWCERVGKDCRLVKDLKFEVYKSCVEKCKEDSEDAFQCANQCLKRDSD